MNEDVIPIVHQWIDGRDAEGTIKYGQPLRTFDGRNTDTDAIEEALDRGLPPAYDADLYRAKCDAVYQHVFESYAGAGRSIYGTP